MWILTGSSGYLGHHLLLESRNRSKACFFSVDRKPNEFSDLTGQYFRTFDIEDLDQIDIISQKNNVEGVIHLAALKDAAESVLKPNEYMNENFHKTKKMIDRVIQLGIPKFIFASSAAVYGNDLGRQSEDLPLSPENPYGISKQLLEEYLSEVTQCHGLSATSVRIFNLSGFSSEASPLITSTGVIQKIVKAGLKQEMFNVHGGFRPTRDGSAIRDFIHVQDVADCLFLLMTQPAKGKHEIVNLGTGEGTSILEIINIINREGTVKVDWCFSSKFSNEADISIAEIGKMLGTFNWKSRRTIDEIIMSEIKHIRKILN